MNTAGLLDLTIFFMTTVGLLLGMGEPPSDPVAHPAQGELMIPIHQHDLTMFSVLNALYLALN